MCFVRLSQQNGYRLLGPKVENSMCLSQGHSDGLPHRKSNQSFATSSTSCATPPLDPRNYRMIANNLSILKVLI